MRGAQHIGQLEKGVLHAEVPMQERFGPPGIDAQQKAGMALHMVVECFLIKNSATGYIHKHGIWLHPCKLIFPNEPSGGPREWQRDHDHVAGTQHVL